MDDHIKEFYSQYSDESPKGNYYKAIALHETADIDWETISQKVPILPKGWYELAQLPAKDRIQFTYDYWLSKLPYHPSIDELLSNFFGALDNIGIFLIEKKYGDPFEVEMVYSLLNNRGFYRATTPATDDDIIRLQKLFQEYILPEDYLAFLQIHDGFCKTIDCTGITSSKNMKTSYNDFQDLLESQNPVTTKSGRLVDPHTLIPFYESFGMPYYQCFWAEWYPDQEMGNVYYSVADNTISDPLKKPDAMAFPTFIDWLLFYLEQIET